MSDELLSQSDGPIHRLTLNRPARRNALTPELARQLARAIDQIEEAGEARVILLSGVGGHFCSGLDLHWLGSLGAGRSIAELQHGLSDFQSAVIAIVRCSDTGPCRRPRYRRRLWLRSRAGLRHAAGGLQRKVHLGFFPDGSGARRWLHLHPAAIGRSRARAACADDRRDGRCSGGALDRDGGGGRRRRFTGRGVAAYVGELLASAGSSIRAIKRLCRGRRRWGPWNRRCPAKGQPSFRRCRARISCRRLEAFTVRASRPGRGPREPGSAGVFPARSAGPAGRPDYRRRHWDRSGYRFLSGSRRGRTWPLPAESRSTSSLPRSSSGRAGPR